MRRRATHSRLDQIEKRLIRPDEVRTVVLDDATAESVAEAIASLPAQDRRDIRAGRVKLVSGVDPIDLV